MTNLETHVIAGEDVDGCGVLAAAADAVLAQCELLVLHMPDAAYTAPSNTLRGGTVGKHLRHTLDHFVAALGAVGNPRHVIEYDKRRRNVPMETDRRLAIAAINSVRDQLALAAGERLDRPVCVRVTIGGDGREAQLRSTLGRELAFATHHAIHHQAMMKAIALEFGIQTNEQLGKAPSTIHSERSS